MLDYFRIFLYVSVLFLSPYLVLVFLEKEKGKRKSEGKSSEKISEGGGMTASWRLMLPLTTTTTTTAIFSSSSSSSSFSSIFFQSPSPSLSSPNPNPFNPFPSYYLFSSSQSHRRYVQGKRSGISSRCKVLLMD